jgi:hypothetical protein
VTCDFRNGMIIIIYIEGDVCYQPTSSGREMDVGLSRVCANESTTVRVIEFLYFNYFIILISLYLLPPSILSDMQASSARVVIQNDSVKYSCSDMFLKVISEVWKF